MAIPNVTLKDIAQALGVTTTTVHRALQGKGGVSDTTRREVQRVAAEMGYRSNYMAATLKRKGLRIALALPDPTNENRYYYNNIWLGARSFLQSVAEFNITPLEFTHQLADGANGAILKDIYENYTDNLDGVLTIAVENSQSSYFVEKLAAKNIPIVFVGNDLYRDHRLCCVKTYDEMAGSLAAELLTAFNTSGVPRKVLMVGHFGNLGMRDQYFNASGFTTYLQKWAPQIEVITSHGVNSARIGQEVRSYLQSGEIDAIYCASARYTILCCTILQELSLAGNVKIIGNDRFDESLAFLQQGTLSAIIDKKIYRQGYLAAKILFDYLVKGEYPPSNIIYVPPEVVLRSNVNPELLKPDTGTLGT